MVSTAWNWKKNFKMFWVSINLNTYPERISKYIIYIFIGNRKSISIFMLKSDRIRDFYVIYDTKRIYVWNYGVGTEQYSFCQIASHFLTSCTSRKVRTNKIPKATDINQVRNTTQNGIVQKCLSYKHASF